MLVIGADCLSKYVDWTDRGTCILFGDGAGAVLVQVTIVFQKLLFFSLIYSSDLLLHKQHKINSGFKLLDVLSLLF